MATRVLPGLLLASAALLAAAAVAAVAAPSRAAGTPAVAVAARFVEPGSGAEAGWGASGQLLLPGAPGLEHRRGDGAAAPSPAAQEVVVPAGGRGVIRVGREIPFVAWFLRRARRAGLAGEEEQWRDVEALLDVEVLPGEGSGEVRLALTPALEFTLGRGRRSVAFAAERVEIALLPGVEARVAAGRGGEDFYGRLLVGYDPLRRVRAAEMILRAAPAGEEAGE